MIKKFTIYGNGENLLLMRKYSTYIDQAAILCLLKAFMPTLKPRINYKKLI